VAPGGQEFVISTALYVPNAGKHIGTNRHLAGGIGDRSQSHGVRCNGSPAKFTI
jgi:hypothetical protein